MRIFCSICVLFILSACMSTTGNSPSVATTNPMNTEDISNQNPDKSNNDFPPIPSNQYSPNPNDDKKMRGPFFLDTSIINIMESYPIQISVSVSGSLPTPCHEFRVEIHQPDELNQIKINLYSVTDPDKLCVQMIQPFEFTIPMGSFSSGNYTIWINESLIGEFDS